MGRDEFPTMQIRAASDVLNRTGGKLHECVATGADGDPMVHVFTRQP